MENFDVAKMLVVLKSVMEILSALLVYFGVAEEDETPVFMQYIDQILNLAEAANDAVTEE